MSAPALFTVKTLPPPSFMREAFGAVRFFTCKPGKSYQTIMKITPDRFLAADCAKRATELIESEIEKIGAASRENTDWILAIPPSGPNGFAIDISNRNGSISGLFGGLEAEFETLGQAMLWVRRALSRNFQLRITEVGNVQKAWHLEPVEGRNPDQTLALGYVSLLDARRERTTVIRRNSFAP